MSVLHNRKQLEEAPGYDILRTYLLTEWNEELTSNVVPNVLAELVRRGHFPTVGAAEAITLDEAARLLTTPKTAPEEIAKQHPSTKPDEIPLWVKLNFRQQQFKLLQALWGAGDVPTPLLIKALSLQSSLNPKDTLRRRKTETNKGLTEKAEQIGALWEIRERTHDEELHFYLQRTSD